MVELPVRRLTCPKCGGQFDYEFIPGGSMTAVRLGSARYLRCPLCHRWSTFSLRRDTDSVHAGPKAPPPAAGSPMGRAGHVRRFSDAPSTVRGAAVLGAIVVAIVLCAYLLPRPEPAVAAVVAGLVGLVLVAGLWLVRGKLQERASSSR